MILRKYDSVFPGLAPTFFSDILADRPIKTVYQPKVDIAENESSFEIYVSLPGFKKEDIKIELDQNKLTVSGERKWEEQEQSKKFHFVESEYGTFRRAFALPNNVKLNEILANYTDGILKLSIPKESKELHKQVITIN